MSGSADSSVPPKKSKAARKTLTTNDEKEKVVENGRDNDSADSDADEKDIFKDVVLEGKRKRSLPASEQFLRSWLEKNFVSETDSDLSTQDMYTVFIEACTSAHVGGVDVPQFTKVKVKLFPDGIALVDDSPYKDTISKKKLKKKKDSEASDDKKPKTPQYNIKEIIHDSITDLGNPRKGLRCSMIANNVMGRYPALRTAWSYKQVAKYVEREMRYGHVECVRGIGACGFYRLPRTKDEEAAEVAEEERVKKEKDKVKKDKLKKDSDQADSGDDADNEDGDATKRKSGKIGKKGTEDVEKSGVDDTKTGAKKKKVPTATLR